MASDRAPTVLVAADDPRVTGRYVRLLEGDYRVRSATDREGALALLDGTVDLILLGGALGGRTDGIVGEVRERGLECPVVSLAAEPPEFDVVEAGFDEVLVEPVAAGELRECVETLLERVRYERAIDEHFSVASRIAAIETTGGGEASDRDRLAERRRSIEAEVRRCVRRLSGEDFETLFRRFRTPGGGSN